MMRTIGKVLDNDAMRNYNSFYTQLSFVTKYVVVNFKQKQARGQSLTILICALRLDSRLLSSVLT